MKQSFKQFGALKPKKQKGIVMKKTAVLFMMMTFFIGGAGNLKEAEAASHAQKEMSSVKNTGKGKSTYLGKKVFPSSFDEIAAIYGSIPEKDEFETTEQYKQRFQAATHNKQGPFIISKKVEDTKYFVYDADKRTLTVKTYAFDNTKFDVSYAFLGVQNPNVVLPSSRPFGFNIDVVISETDEITGSYVGQNSFGAKTHIQKITRTAKVIFQREIAPNKIEEELFIKTGKDGRIGTISNIPPEQAKKFRDNLRIAFVVQPKPPYIVKKRYVDRYGEPTIRHPKETVIDATILIADIQYGLLMDENNVVLDVYDAQGSK